MNCILESGTKIARFTEENADYQEQVRKNIQGARQINQQGIMSQGFRLVNVKEPPTEATSSKKQKVENFD
ncbi:hypothetical protein OK016_19670 [Vibrio chagasii]|nr:hypothetical protein [Vibrio chagasii]